MRDEATDISESTKIALTKMTIKMMSMLDEIFIEINYGTRRNEPLAGAKCQRLGPVDLDGWLSMGTSDMIKLTSMCSLYCTMNISLLIAL